MILGCGRVRYCAPSGSASLMPKIPNFLSPPLPAPTAGTPPAMSPQPPDWRTRLRLASRVLIASDFDGTLACIVPEPDTAVPVPGAVAALSALAQRPDFRLAIVSGQ